LSAVLGTDDVLSRLARRGLTDGPAQPITVDEQRWATTFAAIRYQRLSGLAIDAVEQGELTLEPAAVAQLVEHHRAAMIHALRLERGLLEIASAFGLEGLSFTVLKGPALAHVIYAQPELRPFGDLDLLVHSEDLERASAVLHELGYRRKFLEPRPGFSRRFGHTVLHVGNGLEIDLHRTLVGGPFGSLLDPDELLASSRRFELGGVELQRLDDEGLFLNACIHASLGHRPPLWLPLRDVVETLTLPIDWDRVRGRAARWRLHGVLRHAIAAAGERLGVDPRRSDLVVGATRAPTWIERRAIDAYTTSARSRGGKSLMAVWGIRGARARVAYVYAMLIPNRAFVASRTGGQGSYLRRWRRAVGWIGRSP
jgi:hypothetical protein